MARVNRPFAKMVGQQQQQQQEQQEQEKALEEARAAYRERRKSISATEENWAREVLDSPRFIAAGLEVATFYRVQDDQRPYLQLINVLSRESYNVETETDLPTYEFVAQALRYVERLEVNQELLKLRSRAAACGIQLYDSECRDVTDSFLHGKYKRTHAGLQRFFFDLNAEEIWQQLIQRFSAYLRELNWYAIRSKTSFTFYTDRDAIELNYHEGSLRFVEMRIQEAKKPRKN